MIGVLILVIAVVALTQQKKAPDRLAQGRSSLVPWGLCFQVALGWLVGATVIFVIGLILRAAFRF